jgi:hypothetical protein
MRRMLVIAIVAGLLAAPTASCARETEASAPLTGQAPAGDWPAGVKEGAAGETRLTKEIHCEATVSSWR